MINPTRFAVKKHQEGSLKDGIITDNPIVEYRFDIVEMNGEQYLLLQDRDISYVIEDYEETEDKTSGIILPREKELIV
jgi:co-chaperonin GroES (HSP10)